MSVCLFVLLSRDLSNMYKCLGSTFQGPVQLLGYFLKVEYIFIPSIIQSRMMSVFMSVLLSIAQCRF